MSKEPIKRRSYNMHNVNNKSQYNIEYINNYDYAPGRVVAAIYNFDFTKSIFEQEDAYNTLREDFFGVFYPEGIQLHVSWFAAGDVNGRFVIEIANVNKDEMYYKVETREPSVMVDSIYAAHEIACQVCSMIRSESFDSTLYNILGKQ